MIVGLNNSGVNVLYGGATPGFADLMQVNARLDADEPTGALPLVIQMGSQFSAAVIVSLQCRASLSPSAGIGTGGVDLRIFVVGAAGLEPATSCV